jgi:hypothetical protein
MQSQRFYSKEAPRVHAKGPFGHSGRHRRPLIGRNEPRVFHEIVVIKYSRIGAGGLWRRLPRRSGLVSQTDLREMDIPSALTARPLGRWRSPCRTISTETAGATSSGATTTARSRSGHEWTAITSGNTSLPRLTQRGTSKVSATTMVAANADILWRTTMER